MEIEKDEFKIKATELLKEIQEINESTSLVITRIEAIVYA